MKKVLHYCGDIIRKLDKTLMLAVLSCSALSIVLLYSMYYCKVSSQVSPGTYKTQFIATILGVFCAIILSLIDYEKITKLWFLYVPITILGVLLTFTPLGITRGSADDKAWIDLGITTVQPSEFLKFAFILSFAYHIYKIGDKVNQPLHLLALLAHGCVPILLIVLQGDYGTALIFAIIFVVMFFVGGLAWKYIIGALVLLPVMAIIVWNFLLQDLHKERIKIAFNPELDPSGMGYQPIQGKIALGSGQLYGKGIFSDKLIYVVEGHNDFIFSYVGQTLGFVGCIILCTVFLFICFKIIVNAFHAKDKLGRLICIGVFTLIFSHLVLNIGMVIGVMPVIGVPLPFISAGGTAVLSMYIGIGLILSVHSHNEKNTSIFSGRG